MGMLGCLLHMQDQLASETGRLKVRLLLLLLCSSPAWGCLLSRCSLEREGRPKVRLRLS